MKAMIKLLIGAFLATTLLACGDKPTARVGKTVVSGEADIGGAFSLIDHNGAAQTQEAFVGKPQLIYFGFSYLSLIHI